MRNTLIIQDRNEMSMSPESKMNIPYKQRVHSYEHVVINLFRIFRNYPSQGYYNYM